MFVQYKPQWYFFLLRSTESWETNQTKGTALFQYKQRFPPSREKHLGFFFLINFFFYPLLLPISSNVTTLTGKPGKDQLLAVSAFLPVSSTEPSFGITLHGDGSFPCCPWMTPGVTTLNSKLLLQTKWEQAQGESGPVASTATPSP